jgi:hypothetical protein
LEEVHQRDDFVVQSHHQAKSQIPFERSLHREQKEARDQSYHSWHIFAQRERRVALSFLKTWRGRSLVGIKGFLHFLHVLL